MTNRVVVTGGLLVDGTGAPGQIGDVLVEDDKIVGVGSGIGAVADAKVIDAEGKVVSPGFIDLHTHADYSILAFPTADSALRQGITTIAVGNCGGGVAPISEAHDIRPVAFAFRPEWGVDVTWRSFPEYLELLSGLGTNVAAMVPHGALRNSVMGVRPRPASPDELEAMQQRLEEALQSGAVGMSTGLQYRPGCWAPRSEIRQLVEVVGNHSGIYASHMRDRSESYVAAIEEALDAVAETGAHLQLSHVVARPNAPSEEIERGLAAMSGTTHDRFAVDTFPEPWGPGLLIDLFPDELMEGDTATVLARLTDARARSEMEAYIDAGSSFLARVAGYEEIYLSWVPDRPDLNGFPIAQAPSVGSFCCDVLIEAGERLREVGIRHIYADTSRLDEVLRLPYCIVASDGIVTTGEDDACDILWSASTYGYTARLLEHYVRETGSLSLEDAVHRMTQLPAEALGLTNRGSLTVGKQADLVVFDPDSIHDRSTPTEMARHPAGIDLVLVNGSIAVDEFGVTDAGAGLLAV